MKPSEYTTLINQIESQFPVEQWVVNEIHVWPIIRIHLGLGLAKDNPPAPSTKKVATSFVSQTFRRLRILSSSYIAQTAATIKDYSHNDHDSSYRDALFLSFSLDRQKLGNSYISRFADPLISKLHSSGVSTIMLEQANRNIYRLPRYLPSRFIQWDLDRQTAISILRKLRSSETSVVLNEYQNFKKFLRDLNCERHFLTPNHLAERINTIKNLSKYFQKILKKYQTRIAIATEYYNDTAMALNLACREYGIPSADLQHGGQGDFHHAYGQWRNVPDTGYALLPELFLNWSEEDAVAIKKWSAPLSAYHRPIVIGNPWLTYWKSDPVQPTNEAMEETTKLREKHVNKRFVLITLQSRTIPPRMLEAIKTADAQWFWLVRGHPAHPEHTTYITQQLEKIGNIHYDCVRTTALPLPAVLMISDIHLTHSSGSIIEAEAFGIPSVALDKDGIELFPGPASRGQVTLARPNISLTTQLAQRIDQASTKRQNQISNYKIAIDPLLAEFINKSTTIHDYNS